MLYTTIHCVSATLFFLLGRHTANGAYIEPAVTKGQDINCGDAYNDTCRINCNLVAPDADPIIPNVYCGNTSACIINCFAEGCLKQSHIHANHTRRLDLLSSNKACLQDSYLYLPNHGNASIVSDTQGLYDNVLKKAIIYSGTHTDQINIQCVDGGGTDTKNDCSGLRVHAETANYLHITVNGSQFTEDVGKTSETPAYVYCPQNSLLSPSCIIDADKAESTATLSIYAPKGMPQDVIFYSAGTNGDYTDTTISCLDDTLVSTIQGNSFLGTPCYLTLSPTTQPTTHPTTDPTASPSINPSMAPSKHPTNHPSIYTTSQHPTTHPSLQPTTHPSLQPTTPQPVLKATSKPTQYPTQAPSVSEFSSTIISIDDTTMIGTGDSDDDSTHDSTHNSTIWFINSLPLDLILFVLIGVTVFAICCCLGLFYVNRKRNIRQKQRKHTGNERQFVARKQTENSWEAGENTERKETGEPENREGMRPTLQGIPQRPDSLFSVHSVSIELPDHEEKQLQSVNQIVYEAQNTNVINIIVSSDDDKAQSNDEESMDDGTDGTDSDSLYGDDGKAQSNDEESMDDGTDGTDDDSLYGGGNDLMDKTPVTPHGPSTIKGNDRNKDSDEDKDSGRYTPIQEGLTALGDMVVGEYQ